MSRNQILPSASLRNRWPSTVGINTVYPGPRRQIHGSATVTGSYSSERRTTSSSVSAIRLLAQQLEPRARRVLKSWVALNSSSAKVVFYATNIPKGDRDTSRHY